MRKTKKMAALALTIVMVAGGMTSAYVAGVASEISVEASKDVKSVGGTNMLPTGIIKVVTLSVIIPTTASFNVDMTKILDSEAGGNVTKAVNVQVEQPDNMIYKITSNSTSLVWVYVTGVTLEANEESLPVLTNMYADVKTKDNNVLFAIKDSAKNSPKVGAYDGTTKPEPDEIKAPGYWVTTAISSTDKYYLSSATKGELIAKDSAVNARAGKNGMSLTIYAFTGEGWRAGDKSNVIPVFTVSVTGPTA